MIQLTVLQLRALLSDAAELGATNALIKVGSLKPWISKTEAYRRFGTKTVNRWLIEGLIKLRSSTPNAVKKHINLMEIETVNKAYNTPLYHH
jgi:hypothetical protein